MEDTGYYEEHFEDFHIFVGKCIFLTFHQGYTATYGLAFS